MQINILKRVDWLIAIALAAVILGGAVAWFWFSPKVPSGWKEFKDEQNKLSFIYPIAWTVAPTPGFVSISDQTSSSSPNMLIKINQDSVFINAFGLTDPGVAKIKMGDREWNITHHEYDLPEGNPDYPGKISYTHLYLDNGKNTYMLEIGPWQKDGMNKDLEKLISSFNWLP